MGLRYPFPLGSSSRDPEAERSRLLLAASAGEPRRREVVPSGGGGGALGLAPPPRRRRRRGQRCCCARASSPVLCPSTVRSPPLFDASLAGVPRAAAVALREGTAAAREEQVRGGGQGREGGGAVF